MLGICFDSVSKFCFDNFLCQSQTCFEVYRLVFYPLIISSKLFFLNNLSIVNISIACLADKCKLLSQAFSNVLYKPDTTAVGALRDAPPPKNAPRFFVYSRADDAA